MAWPTGNSITSGWVAVRVLLPPDGWLSQTWIGQLLPLTYPSAWDEVGDISPAIAAAVFRNAWDTMLVQNTTIGQITCFPLDHMDHLQNDPSLALSQYRKCDGASYATADYPDLFALIGYTFGGSGANFNVPDLRGRVVVDAGSGSGLTPRSLGDIFGEENHTLSGGEVPIHSHLYQTPQLVGNIIPPGAGLPFYIPITANTGTAGGGGSHNNIQPSIALTYYIQAVL